MENAARTVGETTFSVEGWHILLFVAVTAVLGATAGGAVPWTIARRSSWRRQLVITAAIVGSIIGPILAYLIVFFFLA